MDQDTTLKFALGGAVAAYIAPDFAGTGVTASLLVGIVAAALSLVSLAAIDYFFAKTIEEALLAFTMIGLFVMVLAVAGMYLYRYAHIGEVLPLFPHIVVAVGTGGVLAAITPHPTSRNRKGAGIG